MRDMRHLIENSSAKQLQQLQLGLLGKNFQADLPERPIYIADEDKWQLAMGAAAKQRAKELGTFNCKALMLGIFGNCVFSIQDALSSIVIAMIVKGSNEPVSAHEAYIGASMWIASLSIRATITYFLLNPLSKEHTTLLPSRVTLAQRVRQITARVFIGLNFLSTAAMDSAAFFALLYTRWSGGGLGWEISYYLILGLVLLFGITHGMSVGFGSCAQSLRNAGLLSAGDFKDNKLIKLFMPLVKLVPGLMVLGHSSAIFVSMLNVLEYFSPIEITSDVSSLYSLLAVVVVGSALPMTWVDYLVVDTKRVFYQMTCGVTQFPMPIRSIYPIATPVRYLYENVYHPALLTKPGQGYMTSYLDGLYKSKKITRVLSMMGIFYTFAQVCMGTTDPLSVSDYPWLLPLLCLSVVLAVVNAKAECDSFALMPLMMALYYKFENVASDAAQYTVVSARELAASMMETLQMMEGLEDTTAEYQQINREYNHIFGS